MESLIQILAFLAVSGTTVALTPDGPNGESFGESELFPEPVASFHSDGFVMGYQETEHETLGTMNLVTMDIARGFSLKRWQLGGANVLEIGGKLGVYHQFTDKKDGAETAGQEADSFSLLSREYLASANVGYLTNGLITRLIWEATRRETDSAFLTAPEDPNNPPDPAANPPSPPTEDILTGDSLRLFIGDVRPVMRYYISYGQFLNLERNDESVPHRDFGYWGIEARLYDESSNSLKLIFGVEQRGYAFNNWKVSNRVRIGLERSSTPIRGWRVLLDWSKGQAEYAADENAEATTTALLFQRLF